MRTATAAPPRADRTFFYSGPVGGVIDLGLAAGEPVTLVRQYHRNGEVQAVVRRADGERLEVPDMWISDSPPEA